MQTLCETGLVTRAARVFPGYELDAPTSARPELWGVVGNGLSHDLIEVND